MLPVCRHGWNTCFTPAGMQSVKTTSPLNREIAPLFRGRHPSEPKLPLATGFDQNNVFAKSRCEIHSHRLFCFMHFADDPAEFLLFSRKIAPGTRLNSGGASVCQKTFEASYFTPKPSRFSCHCEAAARPWQSLSQRHGIPWRSTGARNKKKSLSQKRGFAASFRFLSLHSKVLFRSAQP